MSGLFDNSKRIGMSRKDWQEKCVARRKMKEESSRRAWEKTDNYFRTWNFKSSEYESLGSSQTFVASMNAYEHRSKDEAKLKDLERRRKKLRELLMKESEQNELELRAVLRNARSAESRERQRESRPKTAPYFSTREMLDILPSDRTKGVERTATKKRDAEVIVENKIKELPKKVGFEVDFTDSRPNDNTEELVRKAKILEIEANDLKREHQQLLSFTRDLKELETRRSSLLRSRTKDPFASKIVRPYKVQLQIQSREMIESLEFDIRFLDCLSRIVQKIPSENQQRLLCDIEQVRKKLISTLRREHAETEFFENLYQEEAKSIWLRKQKECNVEADARDSIVKGTVRLIESLVRSSTATVLERSKENLCVREDLMKRLGSTRGGVRSERQKYDSYDDNDGWNPSFRLPAIEQLHLEPVD